jgi:hypothetical protein
MWVTGGALDRSALACPKPDISQRGKAATKVAGRTALRYNAARETSSRLDERLFALSQVHGVQKLRSRVARSSHAKGKRHGSPGSSTLHICSFFSGSCRWIGLVNWPGATGSTKVSLCCFHRASTLPGDYRATGPGIGSAHTGSGGSQVSPSLSLCDAHGFRAVPRVRTDVVSLHSAGLAQRASMAGAANGPGRLLLRAPGQLLHSFERPGLRAGFAGTATPGGLTSPDRTQPRRL